MKLEMRICFLSLALGIATVVFAGAPNGKVVFLIGNNVALAMNDGTGLKILIRENGPTHQPTWSPDGSRIAYRTSPDDSSNALAKIVIVDAQGKVHNSIPVRTKERDGTEIAGMRFVEDSGWYSASAVYASGSVNPQIGEYRVLDVANSNFVTGYLGYDFTTCAGHAQVAYVTDGRGNSGLKGIHIEVNGAALYSPPEDGTALDLTSIRELHWSASCDRLAFLEDEGTNTSFVVFSLGRLESRAALKDKEWQSATVTPVEDSFLVVSGTNSKTYNKNTKSLEQNLVMIRKVRSRNQDRAALITRLGGRSADFWEPRIAKKL